MRKIKNQISKIKDIIEWSSFIVKVLVIFCFITSYGLIVTNNACFAQDRIVAIVNNEAITQKDFDDFVNFMRMQLSQEYKGSRLDEKINKIKQGLFDKLVEDRLILQEAKRLDIKVDDNRIQAKLDEIKKRYPTSAQFSDDLRRQGLTQADLENKIREQMLMYNAVEYKVKSAIIINPAEVTEFYQNNSKDFKSSEQAEVITITAKDEPVAGEVYKELKKGTDTKELPSKFVGVTVDTVVAARNGQFRKDIEDTVFNLKPGDFTEPMDIGSTYYIFKLSKIIPVQQETLALAADKIYAYLFEKKMQEKLASWLDELKKQSYIKVF